MSEKMDPSIADSLGAWIRSATAMMTLLQGDIFALRDRMEAAEDLLEELWRNGAGRPTDTPSSGVSPAGVASGIEPGTGSRVSDLRSYVR